MTSQVCINVLFQNEFYRLCFISNIVPLLHLCITTIGSIPSEISHLDKLSSLVLAGNRMSGSIPNELENITSLRQLHMNGQRDFGGFSGPVPSFESSPHLHDINFSRNSLTGSIPIDFLSAVRSSISHDDYAGVAIDM